MNGNLLAEPRNYWTQNGNAGGRMWGWGPFAFSPASSEGEDSWGVVFVGRFQQKMNHISPSHSPKRLFSDSELMGFHHSALEKDTPDLPPSANKQTNKQQNHFLTPDNKAKIWFEKTLPLQTAPLQYALFFTRPGLAIPHTMSHIPDLFLPCPLPEYYLCLCITAVCFMMTAGSNLYYSLNGLILLTIPDKINIY